MYIMYNVFDLSESLASLTRETGPKVVKGDPAATKLAAGSPHQQHSLLSSTAGAFDVNVSDSALKFTHVLYNLSPAGMYY
jgi:phosphoenolpyruvate carboxykinase (ATP)